MNKPLMMLAALMIFMMGFWVPETHNFPVQVGEATATTGANADNGGKGIAILTQLNASVLAATGGIVVYKNHENNGTSSVTILGPKWRLHHYSNLKIVKVPVFGLIKAGEELGVVATMGNTRKRGAFLQYAIRSLSPKLSQLDIYAPEGWKRIFYVNPTDFFKQGASLD